MTGLRQVAQKLLLRALVWLDSDQPEGVGFARVGRVLIINVRCSDGLTVAAIRARAMTDVLDCMQFTLQLDRRR